MSKELSCTVFENASIAGFALSILMTLGIFISYLPQYWRIHRLRTSEGLSTKFLLLGSTCSVFTLTNILLVTADARECCKEGALSVFDCANSQVNALQIGVQCTCAILILVAVLVWTRHSRQQNQTEYSNLLNVGKIVIAHIIVSLAQVGYALISTKNMRYTIANVNGVISMILTVVKYLPQIATTYRLKHPGTLSVGTMCMQTPGGLLFTASLIVTKGSHWSSWIGYAAALVLQGILLSLCIFFTRKLPEHNLLIESQADLQSPVQSDNEHGI